MKALWFSRHRPTPEQVQNIIDIGYELAGVDDGIRLGSVEMVDWNGVEAVCNGLRRLIRRNGAEAVFGVFPTPIQSHISQNSGNSAIPCFAAWNGKRSIIGGVATFRHVAFVRVGGIYV